MLRALLMTQVLMMSLCMRQVPAVIEMADDLLAEDGCLNFFAGPTDSNFKVPFNFYNALNSTQCIGLRRINGMI